MPFDLEALRVTGLPVPVMESVLMEETTYGVAAHFSISNSGSLVYVPGGLVRDTRTLSWVDRSGNAEALSFAPATTAVRVSPDGKQVLVVKDYDIWIYELERGVERRLTDDQGDEGWAVWTPDGERIVYNSLREGGTLNLYWKPVDGSGPEEMLVESEYWLMPYSWSADGSLFAYHVSNHPTRGFDIWVLRLDGDRNTQPFLQTQHDEMHPAFSPDGRWLAYTSNESGRMEVNLRPYPGPGAVIQVSTDGGMEPIWSPHGKEILLSTPGRESSDGGNVLPR